MLAAQNRPSVTGKDSAAVDGPVALGFPTVETISAQCIAAGLVLGSYFAARADVPRGAG